MGNIKSTLGGPCREKYWSEITADERIVRMRSELKRAQRRIDEQGNAIAKLLTQMAEHEHGSNGQPVMPIVSRYSSQERDMPTSSKGTGDEVWF